MTSERTDECTYYYRLTLRLARQEKHLVKLLKNAPLYCGQTRLSEVDAIISYYRDAQEVDAKVEKTEKELLDAEHHIINLMQAFVIPAGTVLTGEIPGELEYEVWLDEEDNVVEIMKTKDLEPEAKDANIITIKFSGWDEEED